MVTGLFEKPGESPIYVTASSVWREIESGMWVRVGTIRVTGMNADWLTLHGFMRTRPMLARRKGVPVDSLSHGHNAGWHRHGNDRIIADWFERLQYAD